MRRTRDQGLGARDRKTGIGSLLAPFVRELWQFVTIALKNSYIRSSTSRWRKTTGSGRRLARTITGTGRDYENSSLVFSDHERPAVRIEASIAGTTEGNSWEWSWANSNLDPHTKLDMERGREFGATNGYTKLTSAFLEADEHTGWEMTSVAVHILEAFGSYRFPTELGYCYLVFRKRLLLN